MHFTLAVCKYLHVTLNHQRPGFQGLPFIALHEIFIIDIGLDPRRLLPSLRTSLIVLMPTFKCLSLEEFKSVLGSGKKKVAVIFHLTYCGYSKQMLKLFREQADMPAYSRSYDMFVEVDCDEQPDIQHYYGVSMLPHILIFRNSEKVGEVIGKQIVNNALPAMLNRHM